MAINLRDLPKIMRANKWNVGADLMEHWFSLPAATAPPFTNRQDTIVTMKWVLSFKRAREVFDKLVRERVWANDAAQKEIRSMLVRNRLFLSPGATFGVFQSTQPIIHANAVNFRSVNQDLFDGLDDLAAALANFNFHVQIGGEVEAAPGAAKTTVKIMFVGIYVRDQYDFNGDQHLGFWDPKTNRVSAANPFAGEAVTNKDFRLWRSANKMGGDFEVFSDVQVLPLARPDVIEV